MSNVVAEVPDLDEMAQVQRDAKRFNVLVVLIALGALGGFIFVIYKAVASFKEATEEAQSAFGLFAAPRRKAHKKSRSASPRSSRRRPSASRSRSVGLLARSLTAQKTSK